MQVFRVRINFEIMSGISFRGEFFRGYVSFFNDTDFMDFNQYLAKNLADKNLPTKQQLKMTGFSNEGLRHRYLFKKFVELEKYSLVKNIIYEEYEPVFDASQTDNIESESNHRYLFRKFVELEMYSLVKNVIYEEYEPVNNASQSDNIESESNSSNCEQFDAEIDNNDQYGIFTYKERNSTGKFNNKIKPQKIVENKWMPDAKKQYRKTHEENTEHCMMPDWSGTNQ
ncbi:uncharacterized protein LOC111615031 [Centruroides sculpturatus]|uniref:uncharacterized protein LOC111615031 n=1 Tax=Centruroides sculpturatus TaxID=218467 RepID=UPI000C6E02CA|nr:uncharacterized protein LOC111615031 [Centruroides sculpturatus]